MGSTEAVPTYEHLQNLLVEARKFQCEWGHNIPGKPGLSNHLPMALIALYRLGASIEELNRFFNAYLPNLRPLTEADNTITPENFKKYLGTHCDNSAWIHFFQEEVEERGLAETLNEYLPKLMPGVAAAAMHPMIRLGYALDIGSEEEAIHALGAWGYSYIPLAVVVEPKGQLTPEEVFLVIQGSPDLASQPTPDGLITGQLIECSARPSFQEVVCQANPEAFHLGEFARLARLFYLASDGDFTALHCVTSLHAYRNLLPYICEKEATRWLWPILCAAYISRGTPRLLPVEKSEGSSWDQVISSCISSNDDHAIKLAYTSLSESKYHGEEDDYLMVARMETLRVG